MAKMTIEQELMKATGLKPKKGEDQQDWFKRLQAAVEDMKDADWDELSDPAQKWCNAAATAVKKDKDIEGFDDDEAPGGEDGEDDDAAGDAGSDDAGDDDDDAPPAKAAKGKNGKKAEKEKPAPKAAKGKDKEKPEKEKPEKEAKERKSGPKSSGVKVDIKKVIIKDPQASVEDIMSALKKGGTKSPSRPTVAGIRAEFRHSLAVLKSQGLLKGIEL